MANDVIKTLAHCVAFQTVGTGNTSANNTGGITSGGSMTSIYTVPANTNTVIYGIYVSISIGNSGTEDASAVLYYRPGPVPWQNFRSTVTPRSLSGAALSDTTIYAMSAGETFDVFIKAETWVNNPTPIPGNTGTFRENLYIELTGIEST